MHYFDKYGSVHSYTHTHTSNIKKHTRGGAKIKSGAEWRKEGEKICCTTFAGVRFVAATSIKI